jgi:hypothetical protein
MLLCKETNYFIFKRKKFVGFEVFTAVVMKSIIFWDMTPCSQLSCTWRFGGTYRLHLQGRWLATCLLDGLLNYSSTLKMEAIRSSEASGATQRTTRRHIPEDDTLQKKSYSTTPQDQNTADNYSTRPQELRFYKTVIHRVHKIPSLGRNSVSAYFSHLCYTSGPMRPKLIAKNNNKQGEDCILWSNSLRHFFTFFIWLCFKYLTQHFFLKQADLCFLPPSKSQSPPFLQNRWAEARMWNTDDAIIGRANPKYTAENLFQRHSESHTHVECPSA